MPGTRPRSGSLPHAPPQHAHRCSLGWPSTSLPREGACATTSRLCSCPDLLLPGRPPSPESIAWGGSPRNWSMASGTRDPEELRGGGTMVPGQNRFPKLLVRYRPGHCPPGMEKEPKQRSDKGLRSRARGPMEKSSGAMDGRCQPTPGALQRTQPVASRARPGSLQGGCLHRRQEGGSWLGCGRGGTIPLGSPLVVQRSKAPAVPGGQALPPAGGLHPHGLSPGLPALRPEFPHHHNASVRAGGRRDHPAPPWLVRKMT